jgi:hypothetical protein
MLEEKNPEQHKELGQVICTMVILSKDKETNHEKTPWILALAVLVGLSFSRCTG